ncbi:MAG: dihydrodipicolinate synthase family protein [Gammaproteobacteria bacterium]
MSIDRFTGVLAPVITPFDKQLNPDSRRLIAHCHWLLSQGVNLAVFGTNSEANSLSVDERNQLLDALVEAGIDPARMMPGTGCCALTDSVHLTRQAVRLGCRGVLMLPPFYYKGVSDDGLFAFYSEVIQRVGDSALQLYLYHIPPIAQVPLSLNLIDRLVAAYPETVAGIKDSSGDWQNTQALLNAGWENFRVFCGSESFLLATMQGGGAGCISATANVNPAPIRQLWENWQQEDAAERQQALDLCRAFFQGFPMIAALKATLAYTAQDPEWTRVRPPLSALTEQQQAELVSGLRNLDFQMPGLPAG